MSRYIKPYYLALFVILLFAFIIRIFPRLLLPYFYMDDETINMVIPILKMIHAHSLDPHFYKYGSLISYLNIPLYKIYFHLTHIVPLPPPSHDFLNPSLYYIGRYESAVFDILTILITYIIAHRLFDRRVAFLTAVFMAFNPLEVYMSHVFKPDTFMTFFVMCVFYFSIRLKEDNMIKWYVLAGIFSGFAMSTRLDFFVLVIPLTGWYLYFYKNPDAPALKMRKIENLLILFVAACISFCLTSPYLVLHIPEFLHSIVHEFSHEQHIVLMNNIWNNKFVAPFIFIFPALLSVTVYLLFLLGTFLYAKNKGFYSILFLLIYPIVYVVAINLVSNRPSYIYFSYFYLAVVPFFILLAAYAFIYLSDKIRQRYVAWLITALVLVDIIFASFNLTTGSSIYNTLGDWIYKNIPKNSSVLILNSFRPILGFRYYVYPLYTEDLSNETPLQNIIHSFNPGYVIATRQDENLVGGHTYFRQIMTDNRFRRIKTFTPNFTLYGYLFSPLLPDAYNGEISIYEHR